MRSKFLPVVLGLGLSSQVALGQERIEPVFSIWDVVLGQPVSQVPKSAVGEIACGTAGGPPGVMLGSLEDFATCPPEPSGLHEVAFSYDDEQDYIAMARAKGMPPRRVLLGHAFKPSTFSLVTVIGLNFGRLIGGTIILEVIFGLNGLGGYTYAAIQGQDYIAVQGAVLLIACFYVLINFVVFHSQL